MILQSCFINNSDIAHTINEHIQFRANQPRLWLKPYNRYMPESTEWWFIPSKEWPAYHHGKLFIWKTPSYSKTPGLLYIGYYIEHGLDNELGNLSGVNRKQVMTNLWYWKEFVNHAKNGRIDDKTRLISLNSKCHTIVFLKAYEFNRIHEPDKNPNIPVDSLEFYLDHKQNHLCVENQSNKTLKPLNESQSINEIVDILENDKNFRFFWIDIMIGTTLYYSDEEKKGGWEAREIWYQLLEPWPPFVH
ncbi:MAG: hypothetical protein BWX92_02773 [Deltaproteobacteria bacterium ADurb.Bin135]|jgi:hypothetical protein|nr:MAG: hypothetical protein BWX92_02773 [Deltaproteobacteria bacterium ADurb.Bin135]HOD79339.1 hypothetical protein [Syntrophorhabdus sp.]